MVIISMRVKCTRVFVNGDDLARTSRRIPDLFARLEIVGKSVI